MSQLRSTIVDLYYKDWGLYNNPEVNERKAELPIAFWFAQRYSDRLIEIGEVTPLYADVSHTVCDTNPEKRRTLKVDALTVDYTNRNVLSISTVEHVGSGDYSMPVEPHKAIALVKKIVGSADNWLITFAAGSNTELEADMIQEGIDFFLVERSAKNTWRQVNHRNFTKYQYGNPLPHGNAIFVLSNLNVVFTFDTDLWRGDGLD